MKRNKILSSAFVMTMVSFGAFGADKIITSANTCTVDVLGVSDNNATANTIATWDLIDYTLDPGEYLKVTDTSVTETTCPAGSYCVGGGYTVETANNSIAQCPAEYPNSTEGAGADTQCYTACTVDMVAKATAVTGNDYFGSGVDTCGATACETGYHVDGGGIELVEKTPLVPISLTANGDGYGFVRADGTSDSYGFFDVIPADIATAPNTWVTSYSEGIVYGKASCQPKGDAGMEYIMTNRFSIQSGEMSIEEFESSMLPIAGKEKTDYAVNILTGVRDGSVSEEEMYKAIFVVFGSEYDTNYSTTSTGQYCYCQMDGFTPTGGTKEKVTSAPWVFYADYGSADGCASECAEICAMLLDYNDAEYNRGFRAAVVGALEAVETGGICAANTINIDWNPDNNGAHTINQCTYEGAIEVPADPVKPGYTFSGWKLLESTTTE